MSELIRDLIVRVDDGCWPDIDPDDDEYGYNQMVDVLAAHYDAATAATFRHVDARHLAFLPAILRIYGTAEVAGFGAYKSNASGDLDIYPHARTGPVARGLAAVTKRLLADPDPLILALLEEAATTIAATRSTLGATGRPRQMDGLDRATEALRAVTLSPDDIRVLYEAHDGLGYHMDAPELSLLTGPQADVLLLHDLFQGLGYLKAMQAHLTAADTQGKALLCLQLHG